MLTLRIKLAYHTALAWHFNRIATRASHDLKYSDKKSKASRILREAGVRSNIHEANIIELKALISLSK